MHQTFFRSLKNSGKFKSIGKQQYKDFKDKIVDHYILQAILLSIGIVE